MGQVDSSAGDWKEVYRDLRDRIDVGHLAPGDALPTVAQLAEKRGLTTHGARRVMGRLREEGRVKSWQGFGHRVAERNVSYRIDERPRFSANMTRLGRPGASNVIATRTIRLPLELASEMRLRPGTAVLQTEIVRTVEGRPLALTRNHFPLDRFDGIADDIVTTRSVTRALALHGVRDFSRERTQVEVRMPRAHEALQLKIPSNQPVFVTIGRNVDDDGKVVELSHSVWRGDCVTLEI